MIDVTYVNLPSKCLYTYCIYTFIFVSLSTVSKPVFDTDRRQLHRALLELTTSFPRVYFSNGGTTNDSLQNFIRASNITNLRIGLG